MVFFLFLYSFDNYIFDTMKSRKKCRYYNMIIKKITSKQDGLKLEIAIMECKNPKGIVQFSHGMAEHKERYFDFMQYLNKRGYICVIHDHRGHGGSVKSKNDYGYFYTENADYIVDDLFQVTEYVRDMYPGLEVTLFSHSMGTLVARCYLKKYDEYIRRLILCGPPTENSAASFAVGLAKIIKPFFKEKKGNGLLNKMAFAGYESGNRWLSKNLENVDQYEADELCGFLFTTNGFINLFQLMVKAFDKKDWKVTNGELPILMIAGQEDPVIQGKDKFEQLKQFLMGVGYKNVSSKLYPTLKHEILNEKENQRIYEDVYSFIKDAKD